MDSAYAYSRKGMGKRSHRTAKEKEKREEKTSELIIFSILLMSFYFLFLFCNNTHNTEYHCGECSQSFGNDNELAMDCVL